MQSSARYDGFFLDRCTNLLAYLHHPKTVGRGNRRRGARAHALDKRGDLLHQRITFAKLDLFAGNYRVDRTGRRRATAIDLDAARLVVDGDIRVGLEKANFAFPARRDAARVEVRDETVGEADPCVGDVDTVGQNRDADGFERNDLGGRHTQDYVQVVDHQVEHHVDGGVAPVKWATLRARDASISTT